PLRADPGGAVRPCRHDQAAVTDDGAGTAKGPTMRSHRWLVVLVGLLGLAPLRADEPKAAPLTKEQQANLAERDRHLQEAQKLFAARKTSEGLAEVEEALALEREVYGDRSKPVADRLAWLAGVREQLEEFDAARKARQEVVDILTALHGKD